MQLMYLCNEDQVNWEGISVLILLAKIRLTLSIYMIYNDKIVDIYVTICVQVRISVEFWWRSTWYNPCIRFILPSAGAESSEGTGDGNTAYLTIPPEVSYLRSGGSDVNVRLMILCTFKWITVSDPVKQITIGREYEVTWDLNCLSQTWSKDPTMI